MVQKLVLLLVGFGLTTVTGGLLAALLQHRSWRYKWETESAEKVVATAREIFQEISRIMDRRLYRVDQFFLWTRRNAELELKIALENYRSALQDWNDNINRHLSMLQIYFGREIREQFDCEVGAKFVEVGGLVERLYRLKGDVDTSLQEAIEDGIQQLRSQVYEYNLILLNEIEAKTKRVSAQASIFADIKNLFWRDKSHVRPLDS
jgi:hypothetical protein